MADTISAQRALSAPYRGTTISPDDAGYDAARAIYNGSIDRRPALIARPTGAADVIDVVRYAQETGMPLSVRCGGHGIAGTSVVEDGILVDLSSMKGVHVDVERGTAIAQAGVLWGEYDRETELFGRATPGGRVTTTGVGGFCLGGGYGWASAAYGLTCDNLVAADVVTADGRLVRASEDENADLLWGLKGAGANFGIVTSYELRLHAMPAQILAGMLIVPNDDQAPDVMRGYRSYVETAPDMLGTAVVTLLAPPAPFVPAELVGHPVMALVVAWFGDQSEAEEAIRPLRELTGHGMDLVQPMPYTALQSMIDDFAPKGWLNYHRGLHLESMDDSIVEPFLAAGRDIGSPMTQGIMFRNGGAIARVPEDATAAGNRSAPYMAHPIACWATPEESEREMAWVQQFSSAVATATTGRTYLNFEPGTTTADVTSGYGQHKYDQLVQLKDAWDPTNVFRANHNIPPSGWLPPARVPTQSR
jgi:FAD binding domain/Berberine and berberine like